MRKQGWPYPNNPPILNEPNSGIEQRPPFDPSIIKSEEYYSQGIIYRSNEPKGPTLLGEFVSVGDHLLIIIITGVGKTLIEGPGPENIRNKFTWGIVLKPFESSVRVLRQDGSEEVFLKKDKSVRTGMFPYSVGDPVWYDMHGPNRKTGTVVDFQLKQGTEQIQTFRIKDDQTGDISTWDFRNVLIKMELPGPVQNFSSFYNVPQ